MSKSFIAKIAATGAASLTCLALLPVTAAHATIPGDRGLDISLDLPAVDVSGLGVAPSCVVGNVGQKIGIHRDPTSTTATESLTGTGSSNCAGLKITVSILDHSVVPTASDLQVSRTISSTTAKKLTAGTGQDVSWLTANPVGIRPLTEVTFKTVVSHGSSSNCSALRMEIVAGSTYDATPVAC